MNKIGNEEKDSALREGDRPECFGDPDTVSPRDESGFIQPQARCIACEFVKACLQRALRLQGVIPTPVMETPAVSKVSNFLKRWSNQKIAHTNSSGEKTS